MVWIDGMTTPKLSPSRLDDEVMEPHFQSNSKVVFDVDRYHSLGNQRAAFDILALY